MVTKRMDGKKRRQQIIEAALRIVAQKGVTRFTTARLAQETGLSEAGIFKYYSTKEEILGEALELVHHTLAQRVKSILEKDLPAREKVWEILNFQLSFIEKNQGIPRVVFSEQLYLGSPALKDKFFSGTERYFSMLQALIAQGVNEGSFRRDLDLDMAVSTYVGLIQTTVFRWSINDFGWSISGRARRIFSFLMDSWGYPTTKK